MKKLILICIILFSLISVNTISGQYITSLNTSNINKKFINKQDDYYNLNPTLSLKKYDSTNKNMDPDENIIVVYLKKIRNMIEENENIGYYIKVWINGESAAWNENIYTEKEVWFEWPIAHYSIPYNTETPVEIKIEVFIKNNLWFDKKADINPGDEKSITLIYDVKRGDWDGDDYLTDISGYGHLSGFDDSNFNENDFELWFEIYQLELINNQYLDGDRLTFWEENNIYATDPYVNDGYSDLDNDLIPAEWEDMYGYDPDTWDNHLELDPDNDGLQNIEEWQTSQWCSNPFSKDIFIEIDFMEGKNFWNKPYTFSKESGYLLCNAFSKKNINVHLDTGKFGGGGDLMPYEESLDGMELQGARLKYFLNGDPNNWRTGIFHWALICSKISLSGLTREVGGRMFYIDSFVLAKQSIDDNQLKWIYSKGSNPTVGMASVFMHELGHNLGLNHFEGIDNEKTLKFWYLDYWRYGKYYSTMNYRFTYKLIDFSNGDDENYDQDDWNIMDLTRFDIWD